MADFELQKASPVQDTEEDEVSVGEAWGKGALGTINLMYSTSCFVPAAAPYGRYDIMH